ncbi:unnamed protein product [Fraxinus pennsylvanica]|uniref:Uncharacterized protein n=1 Tax=Fraxinus pennsylvanica TaxID=56036 RepID=A0AAD2AB53_9LAMI|nr:unnamed protein product [Fraxinus pennsylvanica]
MHFLLKNKLKVVAPTTMSLRGSVECYNPLATQKHEQSLVMERSEPTLVPEWLKSAGNLTGCGTSLHSDDNAGLKLARNRSSVNSNGHDLGRSLGSDRTTSSYFRRSSSSNGSTHLRSYNSFSRNHRDRDWEKDAYESRDKERSVFGDSRRQDFSDPLGKILSSSFERDGLRRSQSMVSRKHGDNWPKKILIDSSNASGKNTNGLVRQGSPIGSVNKASFERDFPSLGAEERSAAPDIVRVPSPGLSTVIQSLPVGTSAVIGGEKWTSALAEVPALAGSNGTGVSSTQQAPPLSSATVALSMTTGLNMAEAVVQGPPHTQTTPQLSAGTQRLEELAIKKSKQLIPVTPSLPKALVSNSSDKQKTKVGHQQHPHVTNSSRCAAVKPDVSKISSVGKLQVLKPVRERNGFFPAVKENLSPTAGSKANSSLSVASSVSGSAAVRPPPHNPVLHTVEGKPVLTALEKRPTSQAQSRNDFFNLMRKKSMANSSSISDPVMPLSSTVSEKLGETQVSSASTTTEARDAQSPVSSSGGHLSEEGSDMTCNGIERQKCLCNGKKYPRSDPSFSEEEEAAFLRSMGWEENDEEGALTEEEICAFYRDLQKYINSKPSMKILPGVPPKILSPFNSRGIGVIASGLSSSDAKLES